MDGDGTFGARTGGDGDESCGNGQEWVQISVLVHL